MSRSNITILRFSLVTSIPTSTLLRILTEYCPNLVRLETSINGNDCDDSELDSFSGNLCPNLEHVDSPSYLKYIPYFFTFYFKNCIKSAGLKTFQTNSLYEEGNEESPFDALMKYHSKTLAKIELRSCKGQGIQNILSNCRKLERLWIRYGYEALVNYDTILSSDWICSGLKELCLCVDFGGIELNCGPDNDKEAFSIAKDIFNRIGRLHKLERLSLNGRKDILYMAAMTLQEILHCVDYALQNSQISNIYGSFARRLIAGDSWMKQSFS